MEEADLSMGSTEGKEGIMTREDMAVRAEWKVKADTANTISSECAICERALTVYGLCRCHACNCRRSDW